MATDAGAKPQKNVPQAEHMPHVRPRARSSKSSGRVRQMRQRSEEHGCGCGCWCSGAVGVDGWADFGAFLAVGISEFNACGEAWMLPLRDSAPPYEACGVPTAANITELHLCVYARAQCEGPLAKVDVGPRNSKMGTLLSRIATYPSGALRRAGASGDRAIAIAGRDVPPRSRSRF